MVDEINVQEYPSNAPPPIPPSDKPSNFATHLAFIIVLIFILLLKYYLYFASPVTGTGLNGPRLGATLAHLLMWAFTYAMCRGSSRKLKFGAIAAISLFFGILTIPLLGWIGIVVMYVLYRRERQ